MMRYKVIYFVFFLLAIVSCTGNKKYDNLMQRADSIMDVDDDSAKIAIRMLDGIKPQLPDLTKRQRMRYDLLYHKAMNKAYIPFTSDSVMLEVADYYDHHGSANDRMLAYYVLGCVYRDMHEAPTALEYYHKATEQADTTSKDCDYATLARVYGQMATLFDKQYLPYQEIDAFTEAARYASLANDTLNALRFYQNTTSAYDFLGMTDTSALINTRVSKKLNSLGHKRDAAITFGCNYDYFAKKKDWANAKKAFNAYLSTCYEGNSNYKDAKAFLLCEQGTYYMLSNQQDSALQKLHQGLMLSKSYGNKAAISKALAVYYKDKNPSLSASYALQGFEYQDSDIIEVRKDQLQQVQSMYDYSRHKDLAILAEQKVVQRTHVIYLVLLGSLLVVIFLTLMYRRNLLLKKKKITATRFLYEDSLLKLKKLQEELAQLLVKNEEGLSKAVREKEEKIRKLQLEINKLKENSSIPLLSDTDIYLKESSIYKKLRFMELHPKETICDADWDELTIIVEQIIPSIVPLLKNQLNEKEYRICLLVRLGFTTSFIANLVGMSLSGISAIRKRMLGKIYQKEGSPKEFDNLIRKIS